MARRLRGRSVLLAGVIGFRAACSQAQERPENVIRLPEVVVSAPARLPGEPLPLSTVPSSVQVVPGEEIRGSGAQTLQDYLQRLPGVTLSDEQGNSSQPSLGFRGFQGSPVTGIPQGVSVFVDGVRVNEPAAEEVNFDLIPLDDVERIEIVRGPSVAFGRNTLGGAVNIITRRGAEVKEVVPEAGGGSFGRQKYRIHVGGVEKPFDYYFSGTFGHEDGWRDRSAGRLGKAFAKLGYKDDATDVTLSFQHADDRIEQPGSLPLSELRRDRALNFTGGDFFNPRLNLGTINIRRQLGERVAVSANAFGRLLDAEQFNANLAADNTRMFTGAASAGGAVQVSHETRLLGRTNRLVLGIDYAHADVAVKVFEEKNERTLEACAADAAAAGRDPAAACPLKALGTRLRDRQDALGAYAQNTLELFKDALRRGDELVLTAALRWDRLRHDIDDRSPSGADGLNASGTADFSRFSPRVGLNYNASADYGLYASYSQGFRAPAFLELTCAGPAAACPGLQAGTAPDPPLKPVVATTYEAGIRARPAAWLSGELAVFRTDVADEIFSVSPTGTTAVFFQNAGSTRRQGIELALRGRDADVLGAYVNYAYTEATFQDRIVLFTPRPTAGCASPPCTEVVRKGSAFPLIPHHRLNAGIDYRVTKWLTLSLAGAWVGSQWLRGDEENVAGKLRDYIVVNAGLKVRWKRLEGFLWVNNVLNTEYETFGTFAPNPKLPGAPVERFLTPAPPVNVVAGLGARF